MAMETKQGIDLDHQVVEELEENCRIEEKRLGPSNEMKEMGHGRSRSTARTTELVLDLVENPHPLLETVQVNPSSKTEGDSPREKAMPGRDRSS